MVKNPSEFNYIIVCDNRCTICDKLSIYCYNHGIESAFYLGYIYVGQFEYKKEMTLAVTDERKFQKAGDRFF